MVATLTQVLSNILYYPQTIIKAIGQVSTLIILPSLSCSVSETPLSHTSSAVRHKGLTLQLRQGGQHPGPEVPDAGVDRAEARAVAAALHVAHDAVQNLRLAAQQRPARPESPF